MTNFVDSVTRYGKICKKSSKKTTKSGHSLSTFDFALVDEVGDDALGLVGVNVLHLDTKKMEYNIQIWFLKNCISILSC